MPLPRIDPAIPTLVPPFHRNGWVYEEKVDGWRILAYKAGAHVQLVSRTGTDHTERFADIARAIAALPARTLILDGEVAVFDERLVSRFHRLAGVGPEGLITPPIYMAFDVLWLDGQDLRPLPLRERRPILERVVSGGGALVLPVRRLPGNGAEAWAEVQRRGGYEGLVAKDDGAPYRGGPSRTWLKSKVRHEGEFLVGGVLTRQGSRPPGRRARPGRTALPRDGGVGCAAGDDDRAGHVASGAADLALRRSEDPARGDVARAETDGRGAVQRPHGRAAAGAGASGVRDT